MGEDPEDCEVNRGHLKLAAQRMRGWTIGVRLPKGDVWWVESFSDNTLLCWESQAGVGPGLSLSSGHMVTPTSRMCQRRDICDPLSLHIIEMADFGRVTTVTPALPQLYTWSCLSQAEEEKCGPERAPLWEGEVVGDERGGLQEALMLGTAWPFRPQLVPRLALRGHQT